MSQYKVKVTIHHVSGNTYYVEADGITEMVYGVFEYEPSSGERVVTYVEDSSGTNPCNSDQYERQPGESKVVVFVVDQHGTSIGRGTAEYS